ncbi:MAG: sulfatase [Planctomycetes bacterium]|nr:sulfatase [Planctomycetota bacterium]
MKNKQTAKYFQLPLAILGSSLLALPIASGSLLAAERPNVLLCISDDQSYAHTGANGDPIVKTPAFDRVAREGVRFTRAFCDAPTCGPSRSAILTGQHIWRLKEAGNIHSTLPAEFATYTDMLADAGYFVGSTGKSWSPGRLEPGGRTENPAGPLFTDRKLKPPHGGLSNKDYAGNFEDFLSQRPQGTPFCFWLGTHESHRGFELGVGAKSGKDSNEVKVPAFFPDHPVVRNDMLDYYVEVEYFDSVVANAIAQLEQVGELDNTIVVVTSDHGMPFPRAKASLYDAGTRVPLAVRWPARIKEPSRVSDALVNLSDLAATFLLAAGLQPHPAMTSRSLMSELTLSGPIPQAHAFNRAFIAMERHDGCRRGGKGYPCRALRTAKFLYIKNYEPDRWPAGDPDASVCARAIPFGEVDSSPTKQLLLDNADDPEFRRFYDLAFAKHPAEELYDLAKDTDQINNVADDPAYAPTLRKLREEANDYQINTEDPRATGKEALWDYYPYYGLRRNQDWKVDAKPE